jgi:hypothetical protein
MAKLEQIKKITIGTCFAQPDLDLLLKLEKGKDKDGKRMALLDVIGIAKKFKPGSSTFGEFVKFVGQFKATNLRTKDVYTSSACILPKMLEEQLWAVMGAGEVGDVQFAFRIGCEYDEKQARKYVYTAISLLPPAENDALSLIERSIADSAKALPAPKIAG